MSPTVIRFLAVAALVSLGGAAATHAEPAPAHPGLRPAASWIAAMIADALERSPTLVDLVERLSRTRTIVQIVEETTPGHAWDGRISFLASAGGYRHLRVGLRRQSPAVAAAVLAHELQHALEIDGAAVTSVGDFERLYRRIGVASPDAPAEIDTPAAIAAGVAALRELTHRPVWLSARSRRVLASATRSAAR